MLLLLENLSKEGFDLSEHLELEHPVGKEIENVDMGDDRASNTKSNLYTSDTSKTIDITVKTKFKDADEGIIMYSAMQLSEIRQSIASTEWPLFLDEGFKNARGQWDPDRWHQNRKKGSTPPPMEGEKSERRERDYVPNTDRSSITKPLNGQDRSTSCLSTDGNRVIGS